MRYTYLALVCLLACCGTLWLSGCQNPAESQGGSAAELVAYEPPDSNGPAPKITFVKPSHDFGEVPPNKLCKAQIKFTNTGQAPLNITKVSKCCGVVTKLAGSKTQYAPGESGSVLIQWTSGSQPTTFAREFYVHSNDRVNPSSKLKVRAKIIRNFTWEPKSIGLLLDQADVGGRKITIKSLDGRAFSLTSFKSTNNCMTAEIDPSVEATKFVLEPKVDSSKLHSNLKGRILIGLTHPHGNTAIILFNVLAKYRIDPPLLSFFYAQPGKPIVRKMSILSNYEQDFEVESLSSRAGALAVEVLSKRKLTNGHQLEIAVTPPAQEKKMKISDDLVLTLANGEKIPVRCNLWYIKKKITPATATKTR